MIDSSRRTVLTTGAAAAAATTAPQAFGQTPQAAVPQGLPADLKAGFYEKGNVRIREFPPGLCYPVFTLHRDYRTSQLAETASNFGHCCEVPATANYARCRPNALFAELVRLSRTSIADEMREKHRRRVTGDNACRPGSLSSADQKPGNG